MSISERYIDQEPLISYPSDTELLLLDTGNGKCESISLSNLRNWILSPIIFNNSPPPNDISLFPGQSMVTYYNGLSTWPFRVAINGSCVFSVTVICTQNSSTNTDVSIYPNNTSYTSTPFDGWFIENSDWNASQQATSPPYLLPNPQDQVWTPNPPQGCFFMDLFQGPINPPDNLNDIGPYIIRMTIDTNINAKSIKYTSGIAGGASEGFTIWQDTTIPWTSLGYLFVANAGVSSGLVIVKYLG